MPQCSVSAKPHFAAVPNTSGIFYFTIMDLWAFYEDSVLNWINEFRKQCIALGHECEMEDYYIEINILLPTKKEPAEAAIDYVNLNKKA